MRGTPNNGAITKIPFRFIPAGAGNTSFSSTWQPGLAVHPRGCGEHIVRHQEVAHQGGSSPRVRGTRSTTRPLPPALAVHPRGCGEHLNHLTDRFGTDGSSPRVRGTQDVANLEASIIRFIPAGAGNTYWRYTLTSVSPGSSPRVRGTLVIMVRAFIVARFIPAGAGNTTNGERFELHSRVHPRGCGEHIDIVGRVLEKTGSSPRVRGTQCARH